MSAVRLRRLQSDHQQLLGYTSRHPRVQLIQADGDPPERYQLQYQLRSLRQKGDRLIEVDMHLVEIHLPLSYPRLPPQCRMLTPIFHPNIAPHAICIGDHWSAGEPLSALVARIGELIAYQSYNTKSPLNGEAARWVTEHLEELPLDPISLLVDEPAAKPAKPAVAAAAPPAPMATHVADPAPPAPARVRIRCAECKAVLAIPDSLRGKRVRCPHCRKVLTVPEGES